MPLIRIHKAKCLAASASIAMSGCLSMTDYSEILDVEFDSNDLGRTVTVKEYFKELLTTLWEEGEGFSSKRPLGNSSWQYEIYYALADAGVIDQYGDPDEPDVDTARADELILAAIDVMMS
jgi:hypothetical protein